jgi:Mg2+ and Co2+ transporter CorA
LKPAAWLHFNLADVRAKKWISACERIPARAREILLNTDVHIRLEEVEGGFAGVLGDLHFEFDNDPDRLGAIHLYADANMVVTARLHPLKVMDQLRVELRRGMVVTNTLRLVVRFIEDFTDTLATVIAGQGDVIDKAEDDILKDRFFRGRAANLEASDVCWRDCDGISTLSASPWRKQPTDGSRGGAKTTPSNSVAPSNGSTTSLWTWSPSTNGRDSYKRRL